MHKLASYVVREGGLSPADAVGWTLRVCVTVEPLHRAGRPHGRISAKGLESLGPHCEAAGFLLDAGEMPDDLGYQGPERLAGAGASASDDTWAVGVVLYVLLTGALPFAGTNSAAVRASIARGATPLAAFGVEDDRLQPVMDALFEQSPSRRLSWLGDLRSRLLQLYPTCIALGPLKLGKPNLRIFDDDEDDEGEHKLTAVVSREAMFADVRATLARQAAARAAAEEEDDEEGKPTEQLSRAHIDAEVRMALAQAQRGAGGGPPPPPRRAPPGGPLDPSTPSSVRNVAPPPSSSQPSLRTAALAQPSHLGAATVDELSWDDVPELPAPTSSSAAPPSMRGPRPWEPGGDPTYAADGGLRAWHVLGAFVLVALGGVAAYFMYRPDPHHPRTPAPTSTLRAPPATSR